MDVFWFLFGFGGRINRAKYWLALVVLLLWGGFFLLLFAEDIGRIALLLNHAPSDVRLSALIPFFVIGSPLLLLGAWVFAATAIKRLHDRNKSSLWMISYFIVPAFLGKAGARIGMTSVMEISALIALGLTLWGCIELYGLKGTPGTNRFGPDPLSPQKRTGRLVAHR
ncbi:MAG: DUF805 domain-containing protein [Bradyrhizobiaceae bacterium]|nr:MAG: DUF805 domain-containing protein [Bradyrhizobiaceae bacterium]